MAEQEVHELVIIKHRRDHEEEAHHGGTWKIAYADFMTAMMAFFLVLWLLNSTNKEAKISIRNYFNPIKLAEASMTRKGIIDEKDAKPAAAPDTGKKASPDQPGEKKGDNGLFESSPPVPGEKSAKMPSDAKRPEGPAPQEGSKPKEGAKPQETSGKLQDGAKAQPTSKSSEAGKPGEPGAATGSYSETQLFKDPFRALADISAQGPLEPSSAEKAPDRPPAAAGPGGDAAAAYNDPFASISPGSTPQPPVVQAPHPVSPVQAAPPPRPGPAKVEAQAEASGSPSAAAQADAADLQAEMAKALKAETAGQAAPGIEVKATSEGVLISLTDEFDFGMFSIGSAEPQPKLVKIMEKIAQILKARHGQIIVRGHTDGRAYKSFAYDNWRLSSDRAQMARYMLVRGGLDEKRFEAVEGYADHRLKVPGDPTAAENRRIEILLRPEKT